MEALRTQNNAKVTPRKNVRPTPNTYEVDDLMKEAVERTNTGDKSWPIHEEWLEQMVELNKIKDPRNRITEK